MQKYRQPKPKSTLTQLKALVEQYDQKVKSLEAHRRAMKKPSRSTKRNQSSKAANSSYSHSRNLNSSLISYTQHLTQDRSLSNHLLQQSTIAQSYTLPPPETFETFRDSFQKPRESTPELRLKPQKEFYARNKEPNGRLFVDDYKEFSSKNYETGYNLDSTVLHNFGIMSGGSVMILPKVNIIHRDLREDIIDAFQEKISLLEEKLAQVCEEAEANVKYLVEKHKEEIEEIRRMYQSQVYTANRVIEDLQKELETPDSKHSSKSSQFGDSYLDCNARDSKDRLTQDYQTEVEKAKRSLENRYHDKIQALEDQMKKHKKVSEPSSQDSLIREIERSFINERKNLEDAFNTRLKNLEINYERKIALLQELNKTLKKELKAKSTSTTTPKSLKSSSFRLDESLNSILKASAEGLCLRCKAFLKADDELSSIQNKLDSFYYE